MEIQYAIEPVGTHGQLRNLEHPASGLLVERVSHCVTDFRSAEARGGYEVRSPEFKKTRFTIYDPVISTIAIEDQAIAVPNPRAGHSMTLVGEPEDYIMVFGGVTNQSVTLGDGSTSVIKRTLNDLWVYYLKSSQWNQIFPNSKVGPSVRE